MQKSYSSSDIETITRNTDYTNIAETLVYKNPFRILQKFIIFPGTLKGFKLVH